jgi:hypothetical protein
MESGGPHREHLLSNAGRVLLSDTGRRTLRLLALAVTLVGSPVILAGAWLRWAMKCDEGCRSPADASGGGQSWTSHASSWQWDAQFALALVGFLAALAAFYFATARRGPLVAAMGLAGILCGAWLVWYAASPL